MPEVSIVSLDIFQTLVNVTERVPFIWRGILGDNYSDEKAQIGARCMYQCLAPALKVAANSLDFISMRDVFILSARESLALSKMEVNPEVIADNLMSQHTFAPFYSEVQATLDALSKMVSIVLSSDSNRTMVDLLLKKIPHKEAFLSEELHVYKGDMQGRFLFKVIAKLGVAPDAILHIGDSDSEIIAAKKAGIQTCWLNRDGRTWNYPIRPDFEIDTLDKVLALTSSYCMEAIR